MYITTNIFTNNFDIQKLYMMLILRLFVVDGPQSKRRLLPRTTLTAWFCIIDVDSVYCAVRAESIYKIDALLLERVNACVQVLLQ
jgi:hypothetical protein